MTSEPVHYPKCNQLLTLVGPFLVCPQFGLIVTSRPESAVKTPLQGLHPLVPDTRTEANRADFREYERRTPAICFPAEFGMN